MNETLKELCRGMIPCNYCGVEDENIPELMELVERHQEALNNQLSEKEKKIFQKYDDCIREMYARMNENNFVEGFRLGMRMTVEAFSDD